MAKSKTTHKVRNDIILFAVIILSAIAGLVIFNVTKQQGNTVAVIIDGKETARYSLNTDAEKVIETEYGRNTMVIKDGYVSIKDADCPDLVCEKHRKISRDGETIVCLPHKLVLEISEEAYKNSDTVV